MASRITGSKMKLIEGEQIIVELRHHWSVFLLPCLLIVLTLYFYSLHSILALFAFICGALAILSYIYAIKKFLAHRYVLTTHRLIILKGLASSIDLYLSNIEGVKVKTYPLFSTCGHLTVLCIGGSRYHYKTLNNPRLFSQQFLALNKGLR
jgi:hypothetical protein